MSTVIVTPDMVGPITNGGIGTFTYHFARLLRQQGETVTILFTSPSEKPRQSWIQQYEQLQISVIEIPERHTTRHTHGDWWFVRRSEAVTAHLPDNTEVVYLQDWHANGFHLARTQRFIGQRKPVLVGILHSPSRWVQMGMETLPLNIDEALALDFAERYTVQHSDAVLSPSHYMLNWVQEWGWKLPDKRYVVGLPLVLDSTPPIQWTLSPVKRLVYFGRLETRKGLEIFIDALVDVRTEAPHLLDTIHEIILLGKNGLHRYETAANAASILQQQTNIPTHALTHLDTFQAQEFLRNHASDTLVIIPSLVDNYPYSVIETLTIPHLRVIAAATGGIPEIVSAPSATFIPTRRSLAQTLKHWLTLSPPEQSPAYDSESHNQQWLALHNRFKAQVHQQPAISITRQPQVDVAVPHYNHGRYLPQVLDLLAHQTYKAMRVTVVDDASSDADSVAMFWQMRDQYQASGWRFFANEDNLGVSATRNAAVHHSDADYLIFVDADNAPLPNMVERFVEAIELSKNDCVTCYMKGFRGDQMPFHIGDNGVLKEVAPILYHYKPLGNDPVFGLLANIFGDANFIIRRDVFKAIGAFNVHDASERKVGYEDYELLVRLSLAGYQIDVVPEFLFYYRHLEDSLSRTSSYYHNMSRIQRVYRDYLQSLGMGQLAPTVWALYSHYQGLDGRMSHLDARWIAGHIPWYLLLDGMWHKVKKHLRTLPGFRHYLK